MDEILALQQQLAAVQQSSTKQRLSDRNVVEMVMKLQSLNLIELIFTRTGKEYLTHPQLSVEIEDEIQAQGGRVNLTELPDILNVDLHHIQEKMSDIIKPDKGVRLIRGEILTDYYLSNLVEEVDDAISSSQHGYDQIGTIATRYALPVEVVKEAFTTFQDSIHATFDSASGTLRSASSISREHAGACGALRAITTPTVLTEVSKKHQFQSGIIRKVAEELLAKGHVNGTIVGNGSRATFVPEVFSSAASTVIISAFTSSGFVPLERMRRLYLPDIDQFVAEKLTNSITLKQCIIGPVLIETLANSALEAVKNAGWLDVTCSLPPDFPNQDVALVVDKIAGSLQKEHTITGSDDSGAKSGRSRKKGRAASKQHQNHGKSCFAFGDRFIVSPNICQRCAEIVTTDALAKAEKRAANMTEQLDIVVSQTVSPHTVEGEEPAKGKKVKGKGRRRAGGKDKGAVKTTEIKQQDPFPVNIPSPEEAIEIVMQEQAFCEVIESDYLGSSTNGEEMLSDIIEHIFEGDSLRDLYETKAAQAVEALERERAQAKQNLEKELLTGLERAHLFAKATATLPSEELIETSRTWIRDTTCVDALCRIVDIVAQNTGVRQAGLGSAPKLSTKREKMEVIRDACHKLPPTIETKVRVFIAVVSGKENEAVGEFLSLYDEGTMVLDLPERRAVDKKGERAGFANMRAQLTAALDEKGSLSEQRAVHSAAILTHAKTCGGSIVWLPENKTKSFCEAIEEKLKCCELGIALRELREEAEEVMSTRDEDRGEARCTWSQAFADKLKSVREHVG